MTRASKSRIRAEPAPISDVTIANCELECTKKNAVNTVTNAVRIHLVNVKVNGQAMD